MVENEKEFPLDEHKKFAIELFNYAWGLHDKTDRTQDESDEMIFAANASAYHWYKLKGHIDETRWLQSTPRSHNQLANVYIALNRAEPALYHANRCVELCKEREIGDFDIAFGYECLARAYNLTGDTVNRDLNLRLAHDAGGGISSEEDRKFFLSELKKAPGYSEIFTDA